MRLDWRDTADHYLSCWVHKPEKTYTFRFIVGKIIPKSVKCIHSATKITDTPAKVASLLVQSPGPPNHTAGWHGRLGILGF